MSNHFCLEWFRSDLDLSSKGFLKGQMLISYMTDIWYLKDADLFTFIKNIIPFLNIFCELAIVWNFPKEKEIISKWESDKIFLNGNKIDHASEIIFLLQKPMCWTTAAFCLLLCLYVSIVTSSTSAGVCSFQGNTVLDFSYPGLCSLFLLSVKGTVSYSVAATKHHRKPEPLITSKWLYFKKKNNP